MDIFCVYFIGARSDISLSKQGKRILLIGFGFLAGYCALVFAADTLPGSENGAIVIATISSIIMIIFFYKILSRIFLEDLKYGRAWRKWMSESHKDTSVSEIITILPLISNRYAYRFIEFIKENNLLRPSQESFHFVNQLIRLVENPLIENEFSQPLSLFLDDIRDNKFRPMLLDELFQLVNKMKTKLQ